MNNLVVDSIYNSSRASSLELVNEIRMHCAPTDNIKPKVFNAKIFNEKNEETSQ